MKRRSLLTGVVACLLFSPRPGSAQSVELQIARQLRRAGYKDISVRRTLLGRVRITARRGSQSREIVVNPSTGAVLRDFTKDGSGNAHWEDANDRREGYKDKEDEVDNSGRGNSRDDDKDDDDDDDDRERDEDADDDGDSDDEGDDSDDD